MLYIITPSNNSGRNTQRRSQSSVNRRASNGRNGQAKQQFETAINRGIERSDDQVIAPFDAFDLRRSTIPPLSIPKQIMNQVHWFQSTYDSSQIATSTTLDTLGAINFTLGQLPGVLSYQDLFDEYAIVLATVRFLPTSVNAGTSGILGTFATAIDHDDSNAPTLYTDILQYSTCVETKGLQGQTRVVYPRVAVAAYSGVFTSFANTRTWCDIASPSIQHYGIKYAHGATSSVLIYRISVTLTFCCRSNR